VNWFRKDAEGKFFWPGFGENMRVLEWIANRCHGHAEAEEKSIGWVPGYKDIHVQGMAEMTPTRFAEMMKIDPDEWRRELVLQNELFLKIYHELPKEMIYQRELLIARL